jgi:glutaminase
LSAILDLWRVSRVDLSLAPLVADLARGLARDGGRLSMTAAGRHVDLVTALSTELDGEIGVEWFDELDHALEWCEERLLAARPEAPPGSDESGEDPPRRETGSLSTHELFRGLRESELERLRGLLVRRRFASGELLVRAGDPASELFAVVSGRLSVSLPLAAGERRRLATLTAGSVFGELSVLGRDRRTADVVADSTVECEVLPIAAFAALSRDDPLRSVLLENLLRIVSRTARRMTGELAMLAG